MLKFLEKTRKKSIKALTNEPLLTIIMPVYNHEKFVGAAIESVLKQSYKNFEFIIIDDGSQDNSIGVIKSYKDPRIKLFAQKNAGAHNAINKGLLLARGNYIAILNSDDVYECDRFQIMIGFMENNKNIGFLCSYITIINANGEKLGVKKGWRNMEPWKLPSPKDAFSGADKFVNNLLISNFISTTSNFLFKREVYEKIGGMRNLRFAHDWDFALRAAEVTECEIFEQPLMRYRVHSSNTISSNKKWMLFEIAWVWAANLHRFRDVLLTKDNIHGKIVEELSESINLQGNDKVFWMILLYINLQKLKGIDAPEEVLLNDKILREKFIEFIV